MTLDDNEGDSALILHYFGVDRSRLVADLDRSLDDTGHNTTPARVRNAHDAPVGVIERHRNTVREAKEKRDIRFIGKSCKRYCKVP